jgi:signal peptidase II
VDYLSISFFPPVCNFADYCITIGAGLMVIYLMFFSDFMSKKDNNNE